MLRFRDLVFVGLVPLLAACAGAPSAPCSMQLAPPPTQSDQISVRYLGTATTILTIGNFRLLTDPAFDPAGTEYDFGPWYTPRSWAYSRKTQETALTIATIGDFDAALVSHDQHGDNLDHEGRKLLRQDSVRRVFTTTEAAERLANRPEVDEQGRYTLDSGLSIGQKTQGLGWWESCSLTKGDQQLTITAIPARHGPASAPQVDEVIGFLLDWQSPTGGRKTVYISGDTVFFDELEKLPRFLSDRAIPRLDLVMIHVGGVMLPELWFYGDDRFTFSSSEALGFLRFLQPHTVIPIHHSGWVHFREPYQVLADKFTEHALPWSEIVLLDRGQTWDMK